MSTELTIQDPKIIAGAEATGEKLSELPHMQQGLLQWCRDKLDLVRAESKELWRAYKEAKDRKWKTSVLKKHADLSDNRALYYEKLIDVLDAGFCVFPSLDCDLFAIRVDREKPACRSQFFRYPYHPDWEESSDAVASGVGEYVNPVPAKKSYADSQKVPIKDDPNNKVTGRTHYTVGFDKIQFPLSMSKPHIMDAVGKAMALKVFDEIGIIGDKATSQATKRRRRDPLIVGRILNPKRAGYNNGEEDAVTFLISWHIDTKDLEV